MTSSTRELRPDNATLLAFGTAVVLGGINLIAVHAAVRELAPFWAAGSRFAIAAIIMSTVVIVGRRGFPRGRSLWGAALYGTVGFAGSFALAYAGLRDVSAPTGAVIISLVPLFTFGLAIAQGQERFHVQGLAGALIALAGVAVIFAEQLDASVPIGSLLLLVAGAVCMAESGVIVKWIPRSDPFGTNAIAMLTGGALLLLLSLIAGESWLLPSTNETWLAMGYLIVFGSVVMFAAYVFALGRWTASAVSYLTLLMPLVTTSISAVLGVPVSPTFIIGGAVILAGVYIGAFLRIRPNRSSASSAPECFPIDACAEAPAEAASAA